mmetsp:Transcript_62603/g.123721  ORF Transcript_62603/g.123721 Transcript_62603/m.123721 type:complete len:516 (-) Transcript_62603:122-1669(-)
MLIVALLTPANNNTEGDADNGRLPSECVVLIWNCLYITEQMRVSAICTTSRLCAPPAVLLAAGVQRLSRALTSVQAGPRIREVRGLTELAGNLRSALRHYFPALTALLCGLVRSPKACVGTRQCAVGCLGWLLGNPRRVCEIFGEYDCVNGETPVLAPTLETLAWAASQDAFRPGAVEVLVGIARAITAGIRDAVSTAVSAAAGSPNRASSTTALGPWAQAWEERRQLKRQVTSTATAFNRNPEGWWGEQSESRDASNAASFLLENRAVLDSSKVGDFLGRHEEVMTAYVRQFDLRGLGIVQAFSRVLRGLNVPGEAQQVDRFCERFGAAWGEANGFDPDASYIFAFSLVMLSTDLHRPVTPGHDRMTFAQFASSLQRANCCFAEKMVREAYEAIRADALWAQRRSDGEELPIELCERLRRSLCEPRPLSRVNQHELTACLPEGLQGLWQALWSACWGPMLGAFSAGAHGAGENEALREMALRGLQLCCQAAAMLEETEQAQAFCTAMQQLSEAS